ncbi:c-type cytochrome [Sphingomonas sp. R-74633]|uniref:c-type cytochrome n=1 Tax=Sphingomonas sp. R-74633 TaxID=2751188 RepID=UPI00211F13F7|nr:cytochrome c [Sphingomonas sp. R-74633]
MRYAAPLLLAAVAPLTVAALAGSPIQPERGRAVYVAKCAMCHGRSFEGGAEDAPALVGARFETKWRGREAALYSKIKLSMPQDDPGLLTPEQAADVTALILAAQKGK